MGEVKDVRDLKPIVEKTIKTLYGEGVKDIKMREASQYPILAEKKTFWKVVVDFVDEEYERTVELNVNISDGTVTETRETWKWKKA